jgi:hypothetical protein
VADIAVAAQRSSGVMLVDFASGSYSSSGGITAAAHLHFTAFHASSKKVCSIGASTPINSACQLFLMGTLPVTEVTPVAKGYCRLLLLQVISIGLSGRDF